MQQVRGSYAARSHRQLPYLPENPALFPRLPTFNAHLPCPVNYTGRVIWNENKSMRRIGKHRLNRNDSSETNRFTGNVGQFHIPKRRFSNGRRFSPPLAPRNTTSFIIRAKKSGGIASLVSPCVTTPTILTTPTLSPSTEVVVEIARETWGVDGYGTMKDLIRVRSGKENSDETENDGSDCEHLEVEKRLNRDLSRFEIIYPSENSLENRVDKQELRITRLEEQNLTLKEKIIVIEDELSELRRRVLCLETEGMKLRDFSREGVRFEKSVEDDNDN